MYPAHFVFAPPIAPPGVDRVDPTYRFGSTQGGQRAIHHGVEFVNEHGTPVLAAANGVVVVAGDDYQTVYAQRPDFYGNLVIIQHELPAFSVPVYTLYAHLSEVTVTIGQSVTTGETIGLVGFTGTAIGSHLHFEVRFGENDYADTRNPELWLMPHTFEDGLVGGAIAGRVLDEFGDPIVLTTIAIERLSPAGESIQETLYVETYAEHTVQGDEIWNENFALGDLPPGKYRLNFVARGLQSYELEVFPGMVTLVVFEAGK